MKSITPYINFEGDTEEVFEFYKKVFRAEFGIKMRYGEMPPSETGSFPAVSDEQKKKILHVELELGGQTVLMGSDVDPAMGNSITPASQISLMIEAESKEETDRLFSELSEGGQGVMPPEKTFWNAYFGMVKDRYGITWMINHSL